MPKWVAKWITSLSLFDNQIFGFLVKDNPRLFHIQFPFTLEGSQIPLRLLNLLLIFLHRSGWKLVMGPHLIEHEVSHPGKRGDFSHKNYSICDRFLEKSRGKTHTRDAWSRLFTMRSLSGSTIISQSRLSSCNSWQWQSTGSQHQSIQTLTDQHEFIWQGNLNFLLIDLKSFNRENRLMSTIIHKALILSIISKKWW